MRFRVCQEFTLTHVTTSPYSFSHEHCPCPLFKPFPPPSHDDLKLPKKPQLFITNCHFLQLFILFYAFPLTLLPFLVPLSPLRIFFFRLAYLHTASPPRYSIRAARLSFPLAYSHTASAALFHTRGSLFDINAFRGRIAARNPFFRANPYFFLATRHQFFCGNSPRPGRMK